MKKKIVGACVFFFLCGTLCNYLKKIWKIEKKLHLLQYVHNTNMYNCRFRMAPHNNLNDGAPSPQNTKYSVWPPIRWDSANVR